jgi:1-deoxyxylulose-5-phosphate synthase
MNTEPRVGLGTNRLTNTPEHVAFIREAVAAGIRHIDTAHLYTGGESEAVIGSASPDGTLVATKGGYRPGEGAPRVLNSQIEESLRRLRTDRVDLYLAHEPDPATAIEETLAAFDELVRAGKVRHAGLSNFSGAQVDAAAEIAGARGLAAPVNLQNGYSLLERDAAGDAFAVCDRRGIGFTAFSPLAGGWLAGRYRAGRDHPEGSRMTLRPEPYLRYLTDGTYTLVERLDAAAGDRGVTLAVLALAWVLTDPGVTAAIIGPRRPDQLAGLVAASELPLTAADRAALVALDAR